MKTIKFIKNIIRFFECTFGMAAEGEKLSQRQANLDRIVNEKQFHIEDYLGRLKDWTFATEYFPLTIAHARALLEARPRSLRGQPKSDELNELERSIDAAIELLHSKKQRVGCVGEAEQHLIVPRLSTRSAKDVVLQRAETLEYFKTEETHLKQAVSEARAWPDDVRQCIALMRASSRAMAVATGAEVVQLFAQSQRITDDLTTFLRQADESKEPALMSISVRQYVRLQCELEIRVFVANRKIVAMSQYYASLVVPLFETHKSDIQAKVFAAFEQVQPLVPDLVDFVIDFAFDASDRLWVVEINLPPPVAGMALFDKKSAEDKRIVSGQAGAFEFRTRSYTEHCAAVGADLRSCHRIFFDRVAQTDKKKQKTPASQRSIRTSF